MIVLIKKLNNKYPFAFSLILVLVLVEINRILDGFGWMPDHPDRIKLIFLNVFFEFAAVLPFVFIIIYSYNWLIRRRLKIYLILGVTGFTLIGPIIILLINTLLTSIFFGSLSVPITFDIVQKYIPIGTTIFLLLSATYYITHLRLLNAKQIEAIHQAESLTKEVQVKMLRYQINPHFLFNVLNSIHALIDENSNKAKRLVVEMSEYYRYTLNKQQQTIQISDEIEAVTKYLEIQKMRFEDELYYNIQVDDNIRVMHIPPFVIHLLVENAIKYGNMFVDQQLKINISAKLLGKSLQIIVSNTGKLIEKPLGNKTGDGTGSGIENIKNRLALLYSNEYSFSLIEENGWVIATILINSIKPYA